MFAKKEKTQKTIVECDRDGCIHNKNKQCTAEHIRLEWMDYEGFYCHSQEWE